MLVNPHPSLDFNRSLAMPGPLSLTSRTRLGGHDFLEMDWNAGFDRPAVVCTHRFGYFWRMNVKVGFAADLIAPNLDSDVRSAPVANAKDDSTTH
jgi:hypothetical protein